MIDISVDTVRASRDGHQYHEAWLARRALELLLPRDGLCGIAVEGLSEDIEEDIDSAVIEIADATFYMGQYASFDQASNITITQFKYSIAKATVGLRFADIRKTIKKFAISEAHFINSSGEQEAWKKLRYAIVTNRPVSASLAEAIAAASEDRVPETPDAKGQYDSLCAEISLAPHQLKQFCSHVRVIGSSGSLDQVEQGNAAIIADWTVSRDAIARARLGDLRELVRKKAGYAGQGNNIISKVDLLAALGIAEESDLLPTPQAFPETGEVVERDQLHDFMTKLGASGRWLVHAAGGIGKTVFAQSLVTRLVGADEVVLFDCFGGGAYRSPIDGRHRPERGLLHLVNELACRALCDPILPGPSDANEVVRRSIDRFEQVIQTIRRTRPSGRLILIMDAVDNAAMEAKSRSQPSFPTVLMESLVHLPAIDGLVVIATARTERRELTLGRANCSEYELVPFGLKEADAFIRQRRPEATAAQIEALSSRADGNPRVIANLIEPDRSLVAESEHKGKVELNSLIEQRIERAIGLADEKGAQGDLIAGFLCALSALPPPVPIDEMATAFALQKSEIESLAADLSPLLERTRHGLIFRDEPTETLVTKQYGARLSLLESVVARLQQSQDKSIYAARSLPGLLFAMNRVKELHTLAFDIRFPPELDSDVAKRVIRLNRLRTALSAAARSRDFDATVDLLVELSSISLMDERGQDYLLKNPDLVVALADSESLRRLFEIRTSWPGTRHARLTIAYTTDADTAEAYGHAVRTEEWLRWVRDQKDDRKIGQAIRIELEDRVGIPFYLIARNRYADAARYLEGWKGWYAYQLAGRLFELCIVAQAFGKLSPIPDLMKHLRDCARPRPSLIVSALRAFPGLGSETVGVLLRRLAKGLKSSEALEDHHHSTRHEFGSYRVGLIRCALRAVNLGLPRQALAIDRVASPNRYHFYVLHDPFPVESIAPWLLSAVVRAAAENRQIMLTDCLPVELSHLLCNSTIPDTDEAQEQLIRKELSKAPTAGATDEERRMQLSVSDRRRADDYLRGRLRVILDLARCLMSIVEAKGSIELDEAIDRLFMLWQSVQSQSREAMHFDREQARFLDNLYIACTLHTLTALNQVNQTSSRRFSERLSVCEFLKVGVRIDLVRQLAAIPDAHQEAGRIAVETVTEIEREDDVAQRSSLFADLARALLPANLSEAKALFARGVKELDALGSGDYAFTSELLAFSASLRADSVSSDSSFRLAKICELNNYDSYKFPWPLAGKAFSRAWGARYLAQLARWHDRDKVDLELTLPSALTFLIRDRRMDVDDAVPLFGLVEAVEMRDWGWGDVVTSLSSVGAHASHFESLLREYEANHTSGSHFRLKDLRAAFESNPEMFARFGATLDRLQAVDAQRRKIDKNSNGGRPKKTASVVVEDRINADETIAAAIVGVDPLKTGPLESLLVKLIEANVAPVAMRKAFPLLRASVAYGDRDRHIEAIIGMRNWSLFEKIGVLLEIQGAWLSASPSGLAVLKGSGVALVQRHAHELLGGEWGFNWEMNKLTELSGNSRTELAIELVAAATTRDLKASATTWINLASILSTEADGEVSRGALHRLMNSGAARLVDDVGDGPWRNGLDPGDDSAKIAAGLVWFCLGSPDATQRWRAAHTVRQFARFGRWKIVEEMFSSYNCADAGPFQDQKLAFFVLHARLWFLFAIGRIALDHPDRVAAFATTLENIISDDSFPHLAIREAARRALAACMNSIPASKRCDLEERVSAVNQTKFAQRRRRAELGSGFSSKRPDSIPELEPSFRFEYDFGKYDLTQIERLFGIPHWEVEDRCLRWIRKWDSKVESMHDFGGRRKPGWREDYRVGTNDRYHSYGTYAAWHALALVGGELLLERPLVEMQSYEDPWNDWVSRYSITRSDGLWLADGTEGYPLVSQHDLMRGSGKRERPTSDLTVMLSLVGIDSDFAIRRQLTISGSWNSPDGVNVYISSALVPESEADLAARAVATSSDFHMWVPRYRHDHEEADFDPTDYAPLEAWISSEEPYLRLDRYDPVASPAALGRFRPAKKIREQFRLSSEDPWKSTWTVSSKQTLLKSAAWGVRTGAGRSEKWEEGCALNLDRSFLSSVLEADNRSLLMLIKLEHYREKDRVSDEVGSGGDFSYSWTIVTINKQFGIRSYGVNITDKALVDGLPEHTRFEFRERYRVLLGTSEQR